MSARYVQGNAKLTQFLQVATAQYVEYMDAVALQAGTVVRASDITWAAAIATPTAPTVADTAVSQGSPLTNALTAVKISYQFPWGEGALSAAATATPTAAAALLVSGATLIPPSPALWTNIYVEMAAGSGTFKLHNTSIDGSAVIVATYGQGHIPAASPVLSGALQITQFNFAQIFAGISNQRKCSATGPNQSVPFGNNARIFGNSADNQIMVCRQGIFEEDCVSATFTPGQYVGMAKDTGNSLLNQTVVLVSGPALAIGVVAADSNYGGVLQASTKVMVDIDSGLNPQQADWYANLIAGGGGLMP